MEKLSVPEGNTWRLPGAVQGVGLRLWPTVIFFAGHVVLAVAARQMPALSTAHALIVFITGLYAILKARELFAVCIASYIAGSDVFWRMTGSAIFWEFGKYAVSAIFMLGILLHPKKGTSVKTLGLYFLLLFPAAFLSLDQPFADIKRDLSLSLSGPLSIVMAAAFLARLGLNREAFQKVCAWFIAPIVAIAVLSAMGLREIDPTYWGPHSLHAASGGFGPNQVCASLSTGLVLCVMLFILIQKRTGLRYLFLSLGVLFLAQALLTFSRGGVVQAVLALACFFVYLTKHRGSKYILSIVFIAGFGLVFIVHYLLPKLNEMTEGWLSKRYAARETVGGVEVIEATGRYELAVADLQAFVNHPLGIGVGQSQGNYIEKLGVSLPSHTEWTRLLAEHGIFGAVAIIAVWMWIIQRLRGSGRGVLSVVRLGFAANAVLYMFHVGMRTALPGFFIGFLASTIDEDEEIARVRPAASAPGTSRKIPNVSSKG